jgi:glycerol uptake operon antiterminator
LLGFFASGGCMTGEHEQFFQALRRQPVVAGLRHSADVEDAIREGVGVLFILGEDIFALQESVVKAHRQGRLILAHVDLIKGVGRDEAGVRFLARELKVDGILTTRANLIGPAKREGLVAVQRLFVLDSESLEAGLPAVERAAPDAVEVLPGVTFPLIASRLRGTGLPPAIAGGLIRLPAQVEEILASGAVAVSTGQKALWSYSPSPHHSRKGLANDAGLV